MTPAKTTRSSNDWDEYRRLVLAELERLGKATEKLKDQNTQCQQEFLNSITKLREDMYSQISSKHKEAVGNTQKLVVNLTKVIDELEDKLDDYIAGQHTNSSISGRWGFWTAVIAMVSSVAVSIISLVVTLLK